MKEKRGEGRGKNLLIRIVFQFILGFSFTLPLSIKNDTDNLKKKTIGEPFTPKGACAHLSFRVPNVFITTMIITAAAPRTI